MLARAAAIVVAAACPAAAQETLNLSVGYFMVREARSEADILLIEHHDLVFTMRDFSSMAIGGEFLVPVTPRLEGGVGVSFSRRTVPTVHGRVFNDDGSPLRRTLALRQMPIAVTLRMLPLGQQYRVQPYAGGGLAVIRWRFTESGDFAARGSLFRDEHYDKTGATVGPVILFGLRVAGDTLAFGLEGRHHRATGSFGPAFARVRDAEIDLHGWTIDGTIGLRLRLFDRVP